MEEIYEFIEIASRYKKTTKSKYNNEIDAAVKRVREGKSVSNDEVMNEMDNWKNDPKTKTYGVS